MNLHHDIAEILVTRRASDLCVWEWLGLKRLFFLSFFFLSETLAFPHSTHAVTIFTEHHVTWSSRQKNGFCCGGANNA